MSDETKPMPGIEFRSAREVQLEREVKALQDMYSDAVEQLGIVRAQLVEAVANRLRLISAANNWARTLGMGNTGQDGDIKNNCTNALLRAVQAIAAERGKEGET